MTDKDSICMMYRRAHADRHILQILCAVHSLPEGRVREILIENKMMTPEGAYIAPIRLTGKEKPMAQWKWSPQRKAQYAQLVAEGKTREEIAKALGCTTEQVRDHAAQLERGPSPVTTRKVEAEQTPAAPKAAKPAALLPALVQDARDLCSLAWKAEDSGDAAYNLGQLQAKLDLAVQLLSVES